MKNKFILGILVMGIFIFSVTMPVYNLKAQSLNISQFVELLITLGVVPVDKVVAARAAAVTLSQATSTPAVVIAPVVNTIISTSTSYIQVFTPNGGESWEIDLDLPYTITWGSDGLTEARVALVSTNKKIGTCELSNIPVASKKGTHAYKVLLKTAQCYNLATGTSTPLVDGTYKARVYYKDSVGTIIADESNATFKITPKPIPSLTLTYPNGEEQLVRNTEYAIKYSLKNEDDSQDGLIYYYLLDNNGNTAANGHKALRNGTFDLELPSSLSAGAYKIKLKLTTDDERILLEDTSNNFFWISTGL